MEIYLSIDKDSISSALIETSIIPLMHVSGACGGLFSEFPDRFKYLSTK